MRQRQSTCNTSHCKTNAKLESGPYPCYNNNNNTSNYKYNNEKTTSSKQRRQKKLFTTRTKVILSIAALVYIVYIVFVLVVDRPLLLLLQTFIYPIQAFVIDPVASELYKVVDLPEGQHDKLFDYLETNRDNKYKSRPYENHILYGPVRVLSLPRSLEKELRESMRPIMEEFCQCGLQYESMVHGIRLYQNGSSIVRHVDWPDSWVVSATVHVQSAWPEVEWPITLQTGWEWLFGLPGTSFVHKPGQVVLYQGSRTWHYRQGPYMGGDEDYAAVFLGYLPENYPKGTGWPTRFIHGCLQLLKRHRLV